MYTETCKSIPSNIFKAFKNSRKDSNVNGIAKLNKVIDLVLAKTDSQVDDDRTQLPQQTVKLIR